MAKCEYLEGCPFFNDQMTGMESIKEMLKKRYCLGDNSNCARYMVCTTMGKPAVPSNLFPNQQDRAKEIIG